MIDPLGVQVRGAAFYAMHFVPFFKQEFCKVGTVLACDTGDESFFHDNNLINDYLGVKRPEDVWLEGEQVSCVYGFYYE